MIPTPILFSHSLAFFEPVVKSSLKSKVKVQKKQQLKRNNLLSQITSPEVKVPDLAALRKACGRNHYYLSVLLMLEATTMLGLTPAEKEKLMEVSIFSYS